MLIDNFGRKHEYLRISLTERCNLRCFYCMPAEGVSLSPPETIMQAHEVIAIAKTFVGLGIKKIRLTGGEPLVRKDARKILNEIHQMGVEVAITTNGVLVDYYLQDFIKTKARINISLDTLKPKQFGKITRRNYFDKVWNNINLLLDNGIYPKINVVLIKGVNEDQFNAFIELTKNLPVTIQFIEFMPFIGNKWDSSKTINSKILLSETFENYGRHNVLKVIDGKNDTSTKYKIAGYAGSFGFISTVSNPFCDTCNRIRLTANGCIKNCLFSQSETNLLQAFRNNQNLEPIIINAVLNKKRKLGGIETLQNNNVEQFIANNRSMIMIGG